MTATATASAPGPAPAKTVAKAVNKTGFMDLVRLVPSGGPAICNVSVTNMCNATCDFCNFAHNKGFVTHRGWLDAARFEESMTIMKEKANVRFVTFMGGEPLLHPKIIEMVTKATEMGIQPTLVTNGWNLPQKLEALALTGLSTLFISIDSDVEELHEKNRGLKGVCDRIRKSTKRLKELNITPIASVAMTRLIQDYSKLGHFLRELGFEAVTFSYPRKAALGSSSLVYSEDSELVDMSRDELIAAFDGAQSVRDIIPVHNPREGIADMRRRLTGEGERFICHAGYKYFYLDWNYDLWRCEDWNKPISKVWDFSPDKVMREICQSCTTDCYRDASIMLHFSVSLGDSFARLREGKIGAALKSLADRRNLGSIGAIMGHGKRLKGLVSAS